jgi:glycosyltransferase involved in cell wall biosynthesis
VVISDTLHKKCLEIKRDSDIFFDQIGVSFGVSSLEALSQGVVTIACLDSLNIKKIIEFTGSTAIPWINVNNEVELEQAVEELVLNSQYRKKKGAESRAFMESNWHEQKITDLLYDVYSNL